MVLCRKLGASVLSWWVVDATYDLEEVIWRAEKAEGG